jgi:lipid A 3-O-deacylase
MTFRNFLKILGTAAAFFLFLPAPAQAQEPTLEQSIPRNVVLDKRRHIATLIIENDSLGGGTDKNYTSGVRVNYTDILSTLPRPAYWIEKLLPVFTIKKTTALYYSFGQNLYSPRVITSKAVDGDDRPWAAFLYGSMGLVTLTDNHLDEVEATLGIIGPAALGRQSQIFVHKHLTGSPHPEGWSHQLKNEPGVMLAWQRSWPMLATGHIGDGFWTFKPYAGVTAGNVYTYGDAGFSLRLSPEDSKWQDTPLRVRPAMPGTGIYEVPKNKWSWALFAGLEGRAVARDIFLDGNTFANSHSIDKNPFVADATAGAALTYQRFRLSYTIVYRTKEFRNQDNPEIFGAVSASIRF